MLLIGFYFPYDFCRHAGNYHVCGHVFLYHSPGSYYGVLAHRHAGQDDCPRAYPHAAPYAYGTGVDVAAVLRLFSIWVRVTDVMRLPALVTLTAR